MPNPSAIARQRDIDRFALERASLLSFQNRRFKRGERRLDFSLQLVCGLAEFCTLV